VRRLREEVNYFCKCGHVKRQHEGDDYTMWCMGWEYMAGRCSCKEYQVDNLLYLEKLSARTI